MKKYSPILIILITFFVAEMSDQALSFSTEIFESERINQKESFPVDYY